MNDESLLWVRYGFACLEQKCLSNKIQNIFVITPDKVLNIFHLDACTVYLYRCISRFCFIVVLKMIQFLAHPAQ